MASNTRDLSKIFILINGILNALYAATMLISACGTFGITLLWAIPLGILAVYEIIFAANKADALSPEEYTQKAKNYCILDIVAGALSCNIIVLVLAIVNMTTLDKVIEEANAEPGFAPGQPMPGQPMPGQPMPSQPMPGQPMPGQPMPPQGQPGYGQPMPPQGQPMATGQAPAPMGQPVPPMPDPNAPIDPAPPAAPEAPMDQAPIDPPAPSPEQPGEDPNNPTPPPAV